MPEATMAKGEFAAHIGVSPGRITQLISAGKIGPEAIEGEGRSARIRVEIAKAQIAARRDPGQSLGNGLATKLGATEIDASPAAPSRTEGLDEQFKREKLRGAQIANRKAAEEEERRIGRFTETADAKAQMKRIAASMLQSFDGMLPLFATAIAGRFSIPQRDVLHLLRQEFRERRSRAAEGAERDATAKAAVVESIVVGEPEGSA